MLGRGKLLFINSLNTLNETDTTNDFSVSLPIWCDNYDSCSIYSVQIPKSYYGIAGSANTFDIVEDGNPSREITIPVGNYTFRSLATALQTALGVGYTVTANALKGVFDIVSPYTNTTYTFSNTRLAHTLGMDDVQTYSSSSYSTSIILYSTPSILLHSDLSDSSYSGTNALLDDTILSIPVSNTQDLSYILWNNTDVLNYSYNKRSVNVIRFYITDIYNEPLSLNNLPMLIMLMFFNRDDTNELIRTVYKFQATS